MKYIIMVSHGELAQGLHSAVKMMVGDKPEILSYSLSESMGTNDFAEGFKELVKDIQSSDEVIVLCDILGGSPLTTSLSILSDKGLLKKALVFTGMNMPLAITAALMKDTLDKEMLIETLLSEGKEGISQFKLDADDDSEEDI